MNYSKNDSEIIQSIAIVNLTKTLLALLINCILRRYLEIKETTEFNVRSRVLSKPHENQNVAMRSKPKKIHFYTSVNERGIFSSNLSSELLLNRSNLGYDLSKYKKINWKQWTLHWRVLTPAEMIKWVKICYAFKF